MIAIITALDVVMAFSVPGDRPQDPLRVLRAWARHMVATDTWSQELASQYEMHGRVYWVDPDQLRLLEIP